ncbi:hypothetical protein GCM10028777_11900 [Angustibacter speluncae]
MSDPVTLLLLRHGEVASHRGDVPVIAAGRAAAEDAGRALASAAGPVSLLFGGTRRTRETAESLAAGLSAGGATDLVGPQDCFALRNPDLYVAGTRVSMVSSAPALAEQVPGMSAEEAARHPWFEAFFGSEDRIGWWMRHPAPPGETADLLVTRFRHFAASLLDDGPHRDRTVVGVTHSPAIRAVLHASTGRDPGEPGYVTGARLRITSPTEIDVSAFDPQRT